MGFKLHSNHAQQIGYLVKDIHEATAKTAAFYGVETPEIFTTADYSQTQAQYRGQPCYGRIYQSFFNLDNIQMELIQPMDDSPSIWRECLDADGEGLHHIAFIVEGMADAIAHFEQNGAPLVQKGEYKGGRYAYLDDRANSKMIVELLEND